MIDDLWLKIFILIYFLIVAIAMGIDAAYYTKHFKGDKHGRKDNPECRK